MTDSEQLLPCPFCGKAMDANDQDTVYGDVPQWCWNVQCDCGAEITGDDEAEVIKKWNTRQAARAAPAQDDVVIHSPRYLGAAPAQSGSNSNAESVGQTRNMVPGKSPMHAGGITGNDSAPAQPAVERVLLQWLEMHGCWIEVGKAFMSANPNEKYAWATIEQIK